MKKLFFAAFAGMALMFTACNSGGGDPKTVIAQFFAALEKKDMAAARKLATADSKSMLDMMEMGMKTDTKETEKYKAANMEIGEAKIEGDKATVAVKEKESGESVNYVLKKEGGAWKVAFDKATIMSMATEKMGEKGINLTDSINNAMDEIKKLDTDSIADAMKEGVKALDSVGKALEKLDQK